MKLPIRDADLSLENREVLYIWKRLRERVGLHEPTQPQTWLAYIRTLPCVRCSSSPSEPHHFMGSAGPLKSSGIFTVPVCRICHDFYQDAGREFNGYLLEYWCKIAHDWIKGKV